MKMETAIDADALLDHVEFHIIPSQNRYEAFVCCGNKKEKVTSGLLEHLLLHSAEIKALQSKGSNAKYKLRQPENSHDIKWFTKSTFIRFLHIIGSATILDVTNSLKNEISQLEEARKFHLSLYAKGREYQLQSGESEASKNELLRAMDLRLATLTEELITALDQAAGSTYSVEEMSDIERLSKYFGSENLSDSLRKYLELRQGANAVEDNDRVSSTEENNHATKSLLSETQVKYGVSPAKVAQIERQNSTESDESSFSSEEERPSEERSRSMARTASPRRSASPMRRVQIGRSGSRRSTAITIKSLNYFPGRERSSFSKDPAENDGDEGPKKPEFNVRRMSVQDAISLFENKQKDQTVDIQKARSLLTASIGASKSVLRRWSSGMGEEDSSQCVQDTSAEDEDVPKIKDDVQSTEITPEAECPTEDCGSDVKLDLPENGAHSPVNKQEETITNESTDVNEKLIASSEWSRQKEAELDELLMKMMETKPVKSQTVVSANSKRQSLPSGNRGGLYDDYKEKRDEKLRGEATKKRSDKDKQVRAVQQIVDSKKSQPMTSVNASDAGKKQNAKKIQKPQKIVSSQPANPKTESPKPAIVKKASPKASSLPATRKSWSATPSMPSPRANGPSPAKTPAPTSSTMPARRRSQPTTPVSQTSSTVDKTQTRVNKSVKSSQSDSKKASATEIKQQQSVTKPKKTAKSKVQTTPEDLASSTKPSLYNKVTKKSSVVPLESKPFLRKGSGISSGVNPAVKKKTSSLPQEQLKMSEDLTLADENVTVSNSSDVVLTQHEEEEIGELKIDTCTKSVVPTLRSPQKCEDNEGFNECNTTIDDVIDKAVETELRAEVAEEEEEEPTISPAAWVEIEEHEDHTVDHTVDRGFEIANSQQASYVAPVGVTSPRVRHSLSQMLLQEISEHDADWGNAENPPPTVFHKDAPKGLKRLLNFARKSKTDANASGWSSPTVFSEGEDDNDDSKFVNRRSAENPLRKSTLHSKNNGNQRNSTIYEHPGQANISRHNAQSLSQQIQDGHVTASMTTTKATRSFFSLSAFKGSK